MNIEFYTDIDRISTKDNPFKSDYANCDNAKNSINIILPNFATLLADSEEMLIEDICSTIWHEVLHLEIWQCRKKLPDKYIYWFYEEKIIRKITGEPFDPEDYYEYVQLDEAIW